MTAYSYQKLAQILVNHSAGGKKADRVASETISNASEFDAETIYCSG
jgi:hypothetical protein